MRAKNRLTAGFLKSPRGQALRRGRALAGGARRWRGAMGAARDRSRAAAGNGLGRLSGARAGRARKLAGRWRDVAAAGRDPIKEREAEERAARREDISLAVLTADAFEARKAELKGDGTAGRWLSPLTLHVLPKLGKVPVTDLDQRDIRDTLAPLWHTKADTARKALNRLSIVLRHAAALGLDVDLQATEKAKALLGKSRHVAKNIPAMAWADVPGFYASLEEPTPTHLLCGC
jgi:hypothetical protein